MPYRIAFFEPYSDSCSGQQNVLLNLLEHIDDKVFSSEVVVPTAGRFLELLPTNVSRHIISPPPPLQERGWVQYSKLSSLWLNPIKIFSIFWSLILYWLTLAKFLKSHKFDLIYCNSFRAVLLIGIPAYLLRVSIILHEHTALLLKSNLVIRLCFLISKRVIFVSNNMLSCLTEKKVQDQKYRVIHNGISCSQLIVPGEKYRYDDANLRLCFVGKLTPRKNVNILIESISEVQKSLNVSLVIVGDSDDEYLKTLQQLVEEFKLENSVTFVGYQKDVSSFIRESDILVLPSSWETFGLVLLEAYAEKRPVIASKVGGIPEVVVDGETGVLIEPDNRSEITNAILKLGSEPSICSSMGQLGYKLLLEKFSVEQQTKKIETLMLEVLTK